MKYLTIEGQKKIKEELAYLTKIKRVELSKELAFATSLGDLRENSEYDAACEDFIQTENRIYELEQQLTNSKIYKKQNKNTVEIGSKVTIEIDNDLETYEIVGINEADIQNNKISYESPLGASLLNKKINDIVTVDIINPYNVKIIEIN